jgi:MFS family permease
VTSEQAEPGPAETVRAPGVTGEPLQSFRKWAITVSVMVVTVMQVLDTSITNVALPHMQGSLSAGVEEMSWVITSYLAANAIAIPATGWLTAVLGRRRFFLVCTTIFTVSSFLSGIAPNLEYLVAMRVLQRLGGGPVIPMAQATMWEMAGPHEVLGGDRCMTRSRIAARRQPAGAHARDNGRPSARN